MPTPRVDDIAEPPDAYPVHSGLRMSRERIAARPALIETTSELMQLRADNVTLRKENADLRAMAVQLMIAMHEASEKLNALLDD